MTFTWILWIIIAFYSSLNGSISGTRCLRPDCMLWIVVIFFIASLLS